MSTAAETSPKKRNEFLYFAFKNAKLRIGLIIVILFVLLAIFGPMFTHHVINDNEAIGANPPSSQYWLGTTLFGQDVYTQFVYGLRTTILVGLIGGGLAMVIGMLIGFISGFKGGVLDEILNIFTNIILVIPTMAVLLIMAAYLKVRGIIIESIFIGLTSWPWAARAIRAQTFSLGSRDFVDLARLSGMKTIKIIFKEIAPNMMSYLFMTLILEFGGAILTAATLDFIGLGPTQGISLGLMMNYATLGGSLLLGLWWWFIPPGLAITILVGSLYVMNVGLDEVFNPKLREL
ncbi:MAG: ABC transporter permease [Anaerolineaceae bacterium]|jgi:peptide/nickel transport system permease protein|nr:ABC transporter permease [Anaerolineaceae bacterium]